MPYPSPERDLWETLEEHKNSKWGWRFYRTTYSDYSKTAWPTFIAIINHYTQSLVGFTARDGDSEAVSFLRASLEHSFVSDRETLENMT